MVADAPPGPAPETAPPVAPAVRYRAYDPRRAVGRLGLAGVVAVLVGIGLAWLASWPVAVLGAWNAGGIVLVVFSWSHITTYDERRTLQHAAADDPGRTAVYVLVILTSAASLLSATAIVRHAGAVSPTETGLLIALCLSTVALSWIVTHTAFTLRYAHLYYREDEEGVGGIELPGGGAPCYGDFAYVAFTVGMCFQVSDATISSRQIRSTVLLHAVLSFTYNTAILAFVLNLVFGRAGL